MNGSKQTGKDVTSPADTWKTRVLPNVKRLLSMTPSVEVLQELESARRETAPFDRGLFVAMEPYMSAVRGWNQANMFNLSRVKIREAAQELDRARAALINYVEQKEKG